MQLLSKALSALLSEMRVETQLVIGWFMKRFYFHFQILLTTILRFVNDKSRLSRTVCDYPGAASVDSAPAHEKHTFQTPRQNG